MPIKKILNDKNFLEKISHPFIQKVLFIFFFSLYLVTELDGLSSRDFLDYPFGSDVPYYTFGLGAVFKHSLTAGILKIYRFLIDSILHVENSILATKLLFSFFGAVNIAVVYRICAMFFDKYKSALYTACYGLSLSVWYFSSVPESYVITTALYSLYFWYFIKHCSDLNLNKVLILMGILTLALLNDISAFYLLLLPLVYYNKQVIINKKIRNYFLLHIFYFLVCCIAVKIFALPVVEVYSELREDHGPKIFLIGDFLEPLVNVAFFSIGAPSHEVSYAPSLFPDYFGYFVPSLWEYKGHIVTAVFFVFYSSLIIIALSRVQLIDRNKFILPFLIFVGARYLSIVYVNPREAFLYTTTTALPLLLILFYFFDKAHFRFKGVFELMFVLSMAAANIMFLKG